jgi:ABC-type uncharacterized transport system auxiliary subunit
VALTARNSMAAMLIVVLALWVNLAGCGDTEAPATGSNAGGEKSVVTPQSIQGQVAVMRRESVCNFIATNVEPRIVHSDPQLARAWKALDCFK